MLVGVQVPPPTRTRPALRRRSLSFRRHREAIHARGGRALDTCSTGASAPVAFVSAAIGMRKPATVDACTSPESPATCPFRLGARYRTEDGRASVQLVTRDATSPVDSVLSVHVGDDVEDAYAEAQRRGDEIVHPLTTAPWGVRRFFVPRS